MTLSGDNRLKHDLLLKLIDLTRHFPGATRSLLDATSRTNAEQLCKAIRMLLVDKEPTLRSQSLRVLRYLLTDWPMVSLIVHELNMDLFVVRSMERDSKYLWERMQAIKFVRRWMELMAECPTPVPMQTNTNGAINAPSGSKQSSAGRASPLLSAAATASLPPSSQPPASPIPLSRSLVQSLVSIAEQPKDDFRRVCLDALRELALLSPSLVASCNGLRTLIDSILDPACSDLGPTLTLTLLHLLDSEETRTTLRPGVDLMRLMAVFTDTTAPDNPEREHRRVAAHRALVMLMRSWTGILCLTSDSGCLRALIGMLSLPSSVTGANWVRESVFDLIFEVLHVVKAADVRQGAQRARMELASKALGNATSTAQLGDESGRFHASFLTASHPSFHPPNLLHSYMCSILLAFLHCDLVEVLTELALSDGDTRATGGVAENGGQTEESAVACKLLVEIMSLSTELLPKEVCYRIQAMRSVIESAAQFDEDDLATASNGGDGHTMTWRGGPIANRGALVALRQGMRTNKSNANAAAGGGGGKDGNKDGGTGARNKSSSSHERDQASIGRISRRMRAINLLHSLHNGELSFLHGFSHNGGYGVGNAQEASIGSAFIGGAGGGAGHTSALAPGVGWGWSGGIGVHWEAQTMQMAAALAAASNSNASGAGTSSTSGAGLSDKSRRESHEWSSSMNYRTTAGSFSTSAGGVGGRGGGFNDGMDWSSVGGSMPLTPSGRRQFIHGIRMERLAIRCDLSPNDARMISSGGYAFSAGLGIGGPSSECLSHALVLSSSSALQTRNRMAHRMNSFMKSQAFLTPNGGSYTSATGSFDICAAAFGGVCNASSTPLLASTVPSPTSSDFHQEEQDLSLLLKRSNILNTKDFKLWDWDVALSILHRYGGSPCHVSYLVSKTKFIKRLASFSRPDKRNWSELDWNVYHLKYVRVALALVRACIGCHEAREYEWFREWMDAIIMAMLWEIAGSGSGSTNATLSSSVDGYGGRGSTISNDVSSSPSFLAARRLSHLPSLNKSKSRLYATLSRQALTTKLGREYFAIWGILSSSASGLAYFERFGLWPPQAPSTGVVQAVPFSIQHDVLSNLARDHSKDYITKALLANLNFFNGPAVGPVGDRRSIRKVLEAWLAVPSGLVASGEPDVVYNTSAAAGGCSLSLRYFAVEHLLLWWRRHQSSLTSASTQVETDPNGVGASGAVPLASIQNQSGWIASNLAMSAAQIVASAAFNHSSHTNAPLGASATMHSSNLDAHDVTNWIVGLLLSQLPIPDQYLRMTILDALEEMCIADPRVLQSLIDRKPAIIREMAMQTIGGNPTSTPTPTTCGSGSSQKAYPVAHRIMSLFLSTHAGLDFLRQPIQAMNGASWLSVEYEEWKHVSLNTPNGGGALVGYVRGLEEALVHALSPSKKDESEDHMVEEGMSMANSAASTSSNSSSTRALSEDLSTSSTTSTISSGNMWNGPAMRTALDDYYIERLHALPWTAEVTVEFSQGRSVQIMSECFVYTTSHQPGPSPASSGAHTPSSTSQPSTPLSLEKPGLSRAVTSEAEMSGAGQFSTSHLASTSTLVDPSGGANCGGALCPSVQPQTFIVCQLLDVDGMPRPVRIEPNMTVRARISVGAGVHSQNVQDAALLAANAASGASGAGASGVGGSVSGGSGYNSSDSRSYRRYGAGGVGGATSVSSAGSPSIGQDYSAFIEERESDKDWAKTFFLDAPSSLASGMGPSVTGRASTFAHHSFHHHSSRSAPPANEYVCRARDRDRLSPECPVISIPNSHETCAEDEAHFHFEVPMAPENNPPLGATHASCRGFVAGSSPIGFTTLESIWFPVPIPLANGGNGSTGSMPGSGATSSVGSGVSGGGPSSVILQPHFLGSLAQTDEGCSMLRETRLLTELERVIREGGISGTQPAPASPISLATIPTSLEKRAALWALGHIGSSSAGFHMLQQTLPGLVAYISEQAIACTTLSMRGTCFYVLGLLGRSPAARSYLSSLGWCFSPYPGSCITIPSPVPMAATNTALVHQTNGSNAMVTSSPLNRSTRSPSISHSTSSPTPRSLHRTHSNSLGSLLEADSHSPTLTPTPSPFPSMAHASSSSVSIAPASSSAIQPSSASLLSPLSSPLSRFLHLSWPTTRYAYSWALDPSNIYGIASSDRIRKTASATDADASSTTSSSKASAAADVPPPMEALSEMEGLDVVLSHLSNLCNHVTQKTSLSALRSMKSQVVHAPLFSNPRLLFETYKLLACYSFKLPARRFLLFDLLSGVPFNLQTISTFDQPFQAQNITSYANKNCRNTKRDKEREKDDNTTNNNQPAELGNVRAQVEGTPV